MNGKLPKRDWKHFCEILVPLRERYLQDVNALMAARLANPNKTPTEKFWELQKEAERQAKTLHYCLSDYRPSNMLSKMEEMYRCGMLRREDLEGFSPELVSFFETYCIPKKILKYPAG